MKTNFLYVVAIATCLIFIGAPVWAMETDDCLACHTSADDVGEENVINASVFAKTQHAEDGCTGCHEVSDEHPDAGPAPTLSASCADCHDELASTYAASKHGGNAECAECHNPHAALPAAWMAGVQMNGACFKCHELADVGEAHASWLPEAGIHLSAVSCAGCHSSAEKLAITLYIVKPKDERKYAEYEVVNYATLQQRAGGVASIDRDQDGVVSIDEIEAFYADSDNSGLRLWAMLVPEGLKHDFGIIDSCRVCSKCHAAGPDAMADSYVAFPQPDGTFGRLPVEKGATLDPVFGTPDFYMVGATRSKTLNYIGLLILLGGLAMPIGHGSIRFLTRKNRRKEH